MIHGLKPYPLMKDSGVPWLGEVPAGWGVMRAKQHFREVDDRSITGGEEMLSVSHKTGVTPRREKSVTMFMAESNVGHKVCQDGDIVVNTMWAWMAALGVAKEAGLVSPAYGVYRARSAGAFLHPFLDELLRTPAYTAEYLTRSTGITSSRLRLYPDQFLQIPILTPPLPEQHVIVRFLDHVDRRIRRLIAAKQRMIKLLEEQKRAIIHQAVTRGLDPNVKLKPSGVSWLGKVPEHWAVRKIRQLARIEGGLTPSMDNRSFWDGGVPWVTPKDMKRWAVGESILTVSALALSGTSLRLIPEPAVLLVVRGMILARTIPIAVTTAPVTVNQDMKALIPISPMNAEFLGLAMLGAQEPLAALIDEAGHGTKRFPTERWREVELPAPPPEEQAAIVAYLRDMSGRTQSVIDRELAEIHLLREYRTRLIADVVTGKLDVREAAALLPADLETPVPVDDEPSDDPEDADEPNVGEAEA